MMFVAPGLVFANYGMAGCGLGSMLFDENGGFQQVLAATTNGTFGNQTFGISSGTSNCTKNGMVKNEREQEVFIAMNYDSLTQDIARGEGETLSALTNLMGCSKEGATHFATAAKAQYASIYGQTKDANELYEAVKTQVTSDEVLASACKQKA